MPRTFSLARLMIGITLIAAFCGLAVNFPEESILCMVIAGMFIPAAVVCLTLVSFSRERKTVLTLSILGAFISVLFAPAPMHMGPGPLDIWQAIQSEILPNAIALTIVAPLGALLFGGAALADDFLKRRHGP